MSDLPRYILRNCTIFVDRESKIGQASEMELPVPKEKVEELRNAGMVMPIEVKLGYEKLDAKFKMTAFDPQVLKLFGLKVGDVREFMITGALVDEDGATHSAVAYIRGFLMHAKADAWKPGDKKHENEFEVSVRYYRLTIDGEAIIEMDPFEVSVGGQSQTADVRRALLV